MATPLPRINKSSALVYYNVCSPAKTASSRHHQSISQSFQPWAQRAQEKGKSRDGSLHQQLPYLSSPDSFSDRRKWRFSSSCSHKKSMRPQGLIWSGECRKYVVFRSEEVLQVIRVKSGSTIISPEGTVNKQIYYQVPVCYCLVKPSYALRRAPEKAPEKGHLLQSETSLTNRSHSMWVCYLGRRAVHAHIYRNLFSVEHFMWKKMRVCIDDMSGTVMMSQPWEVER